MEMQHANGSCLKHNNFLFLLFGGLECIQGLAFCGMSEWMCCYDTVLQMCHFVW